MWQDFQQLYYLSLTNINSNIFFSSFFSQIFIIWIGLDLRVWSEIGCDLGVWVWVEKESYGYIYREAFLGNSTRKQNRRNVLVPKKHGPL